MGVFIRFCVLVAIPSLCLVIFIVLLTTIDKEKQKKESKIELRSNKAFVVKKSTAEIMSLLISSMIMSPFLIWSIVTNEELWVTIGFSLFIVIPFVPFIYFLFFKIKVDPEKDYIEKIVFGIRTKIYYEEMLCYKELPHMYYLIKTKRKKKFVLFSFMDLFAYNLIYTLNCHKVKVIKNFK